MPYFIKWIHVCGCNLSIKGKVFGLLSCIHRSAHTQYIMLSLERKDAPNIYNKQFWAASLKNLAIVIDPANYFKRLKRLILYTALVEIAKISLYSSAREYVCYCKSTHPSTQTKPYIHLIFVWRMLFLHYRGERENSENWMPVKNTSYTAIDTVNFYVSGARPGWFKALSNINYPAMNLWDVDVILRHCWVGVSTLVEKQRQNPSMPRVVLDKHCLDQSWFLK